MKLPPVIVVQLVHILGPMKGQIQEFTDGIISIGRHPSCSLHFPPDLTSISRKHSEIIREGNKFKLVDHSTNGTYVNGRRITETYLKDGDVLMFAENGPKVSFLTQIKEGQAEAETAIPPPLDREPPLPPVQGKPVPADIPARPEESGSMAPEPEAPQQFDVQRVKAPLIIQYGPTLRSYKELPVTMGSGTHCDFRIDLPGIFDQQAQVFFSQNQYCVKDLTGQKIVMINNQPVATGSPLNMNDELSLGPEGPVFRFLGEGRLIEVSD